MNMKTLVESIQNPDITFLREGLGLAESRRNGNALTREQQIKMANAFLRLGALLAVHEGQQEESGYVLFRSEEIKRGIAM